MKITERMQGDHKTFKKMMTELDALVASSLDASAVRRLIRLVELFADHLIIHSWGEQTFFYPMALKAVVAKGRSSSLSPNYMDTLEEEHQAIENLISRLEKEVKASPPSSAWPKTYALFCEKILDHMRKEEEELFPLSEQLLGKSQLETLSLELERHRAEAPKARFHFGLNK